ncbi:SigE family RNA polymerase sigma factor [Yinghuangia seranimata]|uniref:SigE family RNA polymerase sigma factor n=1 Tax=Yinghuangia seranimata TaxID=408067 RepID=UPI0031BB9264
MRSDERADFHEFAKARWPRLVQTAFLLTGDHGDAEDLVQTALAKAYVAWHKVRASDSPDAYVRRILANCNSDRFRRRRVTQLLSALVPDRADTAPQHGRFEERDALLAALARLPMRQRAVVVLRYWEDMSQEEVAQTLGCTVGTVKSQAAKGLAKLRSDPALAGDDAGGGAARRRSDADDAPGAVAERAGARRAKASRADVPTPRSGAAAYDQTVRSGGAKHGGAGGGRSESRQRAYAEGLSHGCA